MFVNNEHLYWLFEWVVGYQIRKVGGGCINYQSIVFLAMNKHFSQLHVEKVQSVLVKVILYCMKTHTVLRAPHEICMRYSAGRGIYISNNAFLIYIH